MGEFGDDKSSAGSQAKVKLPRLYHKKSRTGCQRCRARRVKCDEGRPACGSCSRHDVPCIYVTPAPTKPTSQQDESTSSSPESQRDLVEKCRRVMAFPLLHLEEATLQQALYASVTEGSTEYEFPECKSRRLLELRLLQNFIENTSRTFSGCHSGDVVHAWAVDAPKIALENDDLLYGIFAVSARHLLKSEPGNADLCVARQTYLGLSLREHRKAVTNLHPQNVEAVCYTSSIILLDSFASVQDRQLEPYSPPMEWMSMSRGAESLFHSATEHMNDFATSKIRPFVTAEPGLGDTEALFAIANRQHLLDLLESHREDELWDLEIQQTYETTLSYVGGIQLAMQTGEHGLGLIRRIMAFASLVPCQFVQFLEEQRPRALVILAHVFACASNMMDVWWIGNAAQREVLAIAKILPQWQTEMMGPLSMVGFRSE